MKTKSRIDPALAWTNLEFEIKDSNLESMMGRPNFVNGPVLGRIKDELQEILFDLTDEGVEMKITYLLNGEHVSMGESYITYLVHLEYPIYVLDRIDVEDYALTLIRERGLPKYVDLFKVETTNELETPLEAISLDKFLEKEF